MGRSARPRDSCGHAAPVLLRHWPSFAAVLHSNHHLPLGMPFSVVLDRLGDLTQWVTPIDSGHESRGFGTLLPWLQLSVAGKDTR